jgi:diphthamide biosynthesis methyltransferase
MFYLIGLGLCDEKDITIRGLEVRMTHRREDWNLKMFLGR